MLKAWALTPVPEARRATAPLAIRVVFMAKCVVIAGKKRATSCECEGRKVAKRQKLVGDL
jgi:hypothetical protein